MTEANACVDPEGLQRLFAVHEVAHALAFLVHSDLPQPVRVRLEKQGERRGSVRLDTPFGDLGPLTQGQVERIAAGMLAGGIACEVVAGEAGRRVPIDYLGAANDRKQLAQFLLARRHEIADESALIDRAVARARDLAEEHRALILALADVLVSAGEFGREDLAELRRGLQQVRTERAEFEANVARIFRETIQEEFTRSRIERARSQRPAPRRGRA